MDSQSVLKYHILVFKFGGLWPTEDASFLYHIYSLAMFIFVYIGFPLSQIWCVLFVDSVEKVVDQLVLTSTVWMASIKAVNLYSHKRSLQKLFGMLMQLDSRVHGLNEQQQFEPIYKISRLLFNAFLVAYLSAWGCIGLQIIWAPPEKVVWTSTLLYPYGWAQGETIYKIGLAYQAASNFYLCIFDAAIDTYGVILLNILGGHIDTLGARLRGIGYSKVDAKSSLKSNAELLTCIKTYEICVG